MAPKAAPKSEGKKAKKQQAETTEEDTNKVTAPDRAAFDERQAVVTSAIDELQKKLKELSGKIGERSGGKDEFFQKKAEIRKRLDEASEKFNDAKAEKDGLMTQLKGKREEGIQMRQELNKMKKSMAFTSEEQIRDRIQAIERQMVTESMTLKEEKQMMDEIKQLKKNTSKVSQYSDMENKVNAAVSPESSLTLKERLDTINSQLTQIMEDKKKVHAEYSALMEERNLQMGDMPQLFEERESLNKQIQEKIKERNEIRDEYREKEREFNAYLAEQRAARAEKARADRDKRSADWEMERRKREADKLEEQPHVAEVTLLEQTIKFCKGLQPKEEVVKEEKKQLDFSSAEGHTVILSKEHRDEEFYFAPTKVKNKGKKTAGKASNSKMIKHNAETFRLFDQLKVDAPITTDDLDKTLKTLNDQLEEYQRKIKDWEVNRDEQRKKILEGAISTTDEAAAPQENSAAEVTEE